MKALEDFYRETGEEQLTSAFEKRLKAKMAPRGGVLWVLAPAAAAAVFLWLCTAMTPAAAQNPQMAGSAHRDLRLVAVMGRGFNP